jgi:hypothetical protein
MKLTTHISLMPRSSPLYIFMPLCLTSKCFNVFVTNNKTISDQMKAQKPDSRKFVRSTHQFTKCRQNQVSFVVHKFKLRGTEFYFTAFITLFTVMRI